MKETVRIKKYSPTIASSSVEDTEEKIESIKLKQNKKITTIKIKISSSHIIHLMWLG